MEDLTEWIKRLIAEDRLSEFYTSRPWRKVRKQAFEAHHYECAECRRKGVLTLLRASGEAVSSDKVEGIGHHIKSVREHPELALDYRNVEPLCWACHNQIEKTQTSNELTEEFW